MVSEQMRHLRLRTQLLIATLILIGLLTSASLLIVRYMVRAQVEQDVRASIAKSLQAFKNVQRQREAQLSRSADLLAELPTLKALMTTEHAPTIQDGSAPFFRLSGSDLLVLADANGRVMALHLSSPGWSTEIAGKHLKSALEKNTSANWWYDQGRLYWVFLRRITSGNDPDATQLGMLAVGYQIDSSFAEQLARVAGSQIALVTGSTVIASTLPKAEEAELQPKLAEDLEAASGSRDVSLAGEQYEVASVLLQEGLPTAVHCYVLLPLARTGAFLRNLNVTIFGLGVAAIVFAAILFTIIARALTRPLDNLVAGVRALAAGDYGYSINPQGSSEIAELGNAFANMRTRLLESQMHRIEAERIAALGRTASSISHDLRHYLSAVVANAEFLYESREDSPDREEIYQEIKTASDQMTDLIDSLRELARERGTVTPVYASIDQVIQRAIEAVNARQDFRNREIVIKKSGDMEGSFDPRKLERVFFNLVLNACEATAGRAGKVLFDVKAHDDEFEIRVTDNGPGIPVAIRESLFDPFVSYGKPNGTGLGLAIVSKIVADHNGQVLIERTSEMGTTVLIRMPRFTSSTTNSQTVNA